MRDPSVTVQTERLSSGGAAGLDAVVEVDDRALAYLDTALDAEWQIGSEGPIDAEGETTAVRSMIVARGRSEALSSHARRRFASPTAA